MKEEKSEGAKHRILNMCAKIQIYVFEGYKNAEKSEITLKKHEKLKKWKIERQTSYKWYSSTVSTFPPLFCALSPLLCVRSFSEHSPRLGWKVILKFDG